MRVLFMGSPAFAVPSLAAILASSHELVAVVTQPGRAKGRGRQPTPSDVAAAARRRGVRVLEPVRLDAAFLAELRALAPDVLAVVAYGKLLPPGVLDLPPRGAVNVHPSLLPRHRGAAPIQHAVLCGDEETGVTTMLLDEGMDTGPILLVERTPIGPEEDAAALGERLAAIGARLLVATLDGLARDLEPRPQPAEGVTYAPKLAPDDAWVDWSRPAAQLARRVRGLRPWPMAQTLLPGGRRLKLIAVRAVAGRGSGEPGKVVAADADGVVVTCGDGCLVLHQAQVEGKRPGSARDLVNGRVVRAGDRLGRS